MKYAALLLASFTMLATGSPVCAEGPNLVPVAELGLRYRGYYLVGDDHSGALDNRPEQLVRLGMRGSAPRDLLTAELTLATGDRHRPTFNWTPAGRFGEGAWFNLDTAYVSVAPDPLPELQILVGQVPIPWSHGGLVWDSDVALPGLFLDYDWSSEGLFSSIRFKPGYVYLFAGEPDPSDEIFVVGGELGTTLALGGVSLDLDLGTFHLFGARDFGRAVAREDIVVGQRPAGFTSNTTDTDSEDPDAEITKRLVTNGLASEFRLVSTRIAATLDVGDDLPLAVHAHAVLNLGASGPGDGHNLAFESGVKVGEARRPGLGEVALLGLYIEADAVLDAFNRDTYSTNLTGVGVRGALMALDGLTIGFDALWSWQVEERLRGFGDGRGELEGTAAQAIQMHLSGRYAL